MTLRRVAAVMVFLFVIGFVVGTSMSPAQAGTVQITGSRDGNRVVVVGTVAGFPAWVTFMPVYRVNGGEERRGIPFISSGEFRWSRYAYRRDMEVRIIAADGTASNTVVIPWR